MKVTIDDVVCLAADLGILQSTTEDNTEKAYTELMKLVEDDPEKFLVVYTQSLLDHIQLGTVNLTGKEEHCVGFGLSHTRGVEMFIKRSWEPKVPRGQWWRPTSWV